MTETWILANTDRSVSLTVEIACSWWARFKGLRPLVKDVDCTSRRRTASTCASCVLQSMRCISMEKAVW